LEKGGRAWLDEENQLIAVQTSLRLYEELKQYFRPEFQTVLDEIIVFRQLTKDEVKQISSILLRGL